MHQSQWTTMAWLFGKYLPTSGVVYDIGSYDVNGSHKPQILQRGLTYVGVDVLDGPNVDLVVEPYNWHPLPENGCEYIISGSCLEHVEAPWMWAKEIARRLKPGGICIVLLPFYLTEHRYPVDCYRILPDGLKFLFVKWAGLECLECGITQENEDTYFVGIKKLPNKQKPDRIVTYIQLR